MLYLLFIGLSPLPVTVTTRIITFLVGDPYKPSFPLLLGGGTTQSIYILFAGSVQTRVVSNCHAIDANVSGENWSTM